MSSSNSTRINFHADQLSRVITAIQNRIDLFTDLRDKRGFIYSHFAEDYVRLSLELKFASKYIKPVYFETLYWVDVPIDLTQAISVLITTCDTLSQIVQTNGDISTADYIVCLSFERHAACLQEKMNIMLAQALQAQEQRLAVEARKREFDEEMSRAVQAVEQRLAEEEARDHEFVEKQRLAAEAQKRKLAEEIYIYNMLFNSSNVTTTDDSSSSN